jgi:3,4-dihydroxy 2-butanone 4-phosphate synthase/GTP cyclohydrolase II
LCIFAAYEGFSFLGRAAPLLFVAPIGENRRVSMAESTRIFEPPFVDVPGALAEIRAGKMVVVVDDEDRENEGDLTLASEFVTPEAINFMAKFGRGLICLTLTEERADYLRLFPMTQQNSSRFGTAFTETIEAREGVTTGISAADRSHTIQTAIASSSTAADLARPGHIFPLRARQGGVLVRAGQTEASVDLARMAGLNPSGVICEIMRDDGEMARIPDLIPFCKEHGLRILTVAELIRYRLRHERYIVRAGESRIQTRYGEFRMIAYESQVNGGESHIALVRGDLCPGCPAFHQGPSVCCLQGDSELPACGASEVRPPCERPVLVRVHTRCTAGDVFAADCRCRETLDQSMRMIAAEGCGVLLYLHNTSRGFEIDHAPAAESAFGPGGAASLHAVADSTSGQLVLHQELRAREGSQARTGRILRAIGLGGQILSGLGIRRIRLLSNTPMHIPALEGFGLEIVEQVAIPLEKLDQAG